MAIYLSDDGSLDTVFVCDSCFETFRCNYANSDSELSYDDWIQNEQEDIEAEHECETVHVLRETLFGNWFCDTCNSPYCGNL